MKDGDISRRRRLDPIRRHYYARYRQWRQARRILGVDHLPHPAAGIIAPLDKLIAELLRAPTIDDHRVRVSRLFSLFRMETLMVMKGWIVSKPRSEVERLNPLHDNPESRSPCVLLIDTSISMTNSMAQVNQGLADFASILTSDALVSERVEVAIVTFGPIRVVQEFLLASEFVSPHLKAIGMTPGFGALLKAGEIVKERLALYKHHELDSTRPFVLVITDGAFSDTELTDAAKAMIADFEGAPNPADRVAFFFVGVDGADMSALASLSCRKPLPLKHANYRAMFRWVAASMQAISRSVVGEEVDLPPADWGKL